jgi:hypothetical protein
MDLGGKSLVEWLKEQDPAQLPTTGHNYLAGYAALETYLREHVHSQVNAASALADGGLLTDHGPAHIQKLIHRMGELLKSGEGPLTPYEVYILLVAAQFHDVGNIFGRTAHEERAAQVMQEAGKLVGIDMVERRCIFDIARAHGGADKDKLRHLQRQDYVCSQQVRMQMLAAILKFADELAEDSERAARFLLEGGRLPQQSELYHAYAQSLNSVAVDRLARAVVMRFDLRRPTALRMFLKPAPGEPDRQVYLMDEIFLRTMKTHYERSYCSRFMRPLVEVDAVSVTIEVTDDAGYTVLEKIQYRLEDTGYPDVGKDIYAMCPELERYAFASGRPPGTTGRLDGASLSQQLRN